MNDNISEQEKPQCDTTRSELQDMLIPIWEEMGEVKTLLWAIAGKAKEATQIVDDHGNAKPHIHMGPADNVRPHPFRTGEPSPQLRKGIHTQIPEAHPKAQGTEWRSHGG